MSKELYIKKEETLKELREVSGLVGILEHFLKENEKNFKREESIKALRRIREYLKEKQKIHDRLETQFKEQSVKLMRICKHDISIKSRPFSSYHCLMCEKNMGEKDIPNISVDTTSDYQTEYIIEEQFQSTVYSENDLVQTMLSLIEDMQYERDIKVYRR